MAKPLSVAICQNHLPIITALCLADGFLLVWHVVVHPNFEASLSIELVKFNTSISHFKFLAFQMENVLMCS